ncbi:CCA tRNA nucleotidyltransferase [Shouchella lonarensis]|uniref:tRNA nucleotidyltransferase (CCA-adding enzyme) n=1 Tax=Shouchella lonarensis TaxID=1464122 RepID=A0A1G6H9Z9_9BACI|nr:CCA tRNA nucleotidyltransferase [Shouchella lonarensis]SDB91092.1 tRNA nucleotidyltransferase (CCA-adding enzyme) [Shouchella lonarensis]
MSVEKAYPVLRCLHEAGYEAYVVGGAVRDTLLARPVHDLDVATSADAATVRKLFPKTVQMNERHETVLLFHNGVPVEVTMFKGETLEADLQKRDLTINSLAMTAEGALIDVVGGQADLQIGILRAYAPEDVFVDDPLRLLRVARFQSELGFRVDEMLQAEMTARRAQLTNVANERVAAELERLFAGAFAQASLSLLHHTGVGAHIAVFPLTDARYQQLRTLPDEHWDDGVRVWLEVAVSLGEVGFLAALPIAKKQKQSVKQAYAGYIKRQMAALNDWELYELGLPLAQLIEDVRRSRGEDAISRVVLAQQYEALPIQSRHALAINGHDLLAVSGKKPGPWLAAALEKAEYAVVTGVVANERAALQSFLQGEIG